MWFGFTASTVLCCCQRYLLMSMTIISYFYSNRIKVRKNYENIKTKLKYYKQATSSRRAIIKFCCRNWITSKLDEISPVPPSVCLSVRKLPFKWYQQNYYLNTPLGGWIGFGWVVRRNLHHLQVPTRTFFYIDCRILYLNIYILFTKQQIVFYKTI